MTVFFVILGACLAPSILFYSLLVRSMDRHESDVRLLLDGMSIEQARHQEERRQLLERIQRPEYQPSAPVREHVLPPEPFEPDIGLVGVAAPDLPPEPDTE